MDDHRILLFGGWAGGEEGHVAHVHQLDLGPMAWSEIEPSGEPHPGTSQAAAVDVGAGLLFFGGWDGKRRTNETTLFQFDQHQWNKYETVGDKPPGLTFHTLSLIGRRVYVYGGNHSEGQNGDVFILDLNANAWGTATSLGAPPKRSSHTATVVNDHQIVVFGGRGETGNALNDVAVLDGSNGHWAINAKVLDGPAPGPRYGHSASPVGPNVLVFGGTGENRQLLNDLWLLRVDKMTGMQWQKVATEGPPPSIRTNHCALDNLSSMYVIGGRMDGFGDVSAQVYALDTSAVAPLPSMAEKDGEGHDGEPSGHPSTTPGTELTG
jgi:N-acetylneuraminic acid mutarotase